MGHAHALCEGEPEVLTLPQVRQEDSQGAARIIVRTVAAALVLLTVIGGTDGTSNRDRDDTEQRVDYIYRSSASLDALAISWIGNVQQDVSFEPYLGGRVNVQDRVRASMWVSVVTRPSAVEGDDPTEHAENAERLGVYVSMRLASVGTPQDIPNVGYGPVTSTSRVQEIVCAPGLPWECSWVLRVVACESTNRSDAWATEWHRGEQFWFHGLWQHVSRSPDPGLLADPVFNTQRAAEKYRAGGASHWPSCP